jgi:cephalosporin hydroxylase
MNNVEDYLRHYYDTGIWQRVRYRGLRTLKFVPDLWNYQEIIHERDVQWVIETGSRHGGSALFFADLLAARGAHGRVISIDIDFDTNAQVEHPGIEFLYGDSASPEIVDSVKRLLGASPGRVFAILDSDHRQDHVLRELEVYVPLLKSGDYLIVEDTCVNGHPIVPDFGPGPWEAIEKWLAANPGILHHDVERENKFGVTFAPNGYYYRV